MKFDRLRLTGFKSFVDPTDVIIAPGLTGVVGPNGCGKSNLVEALRWVMGEASYKSVRGASMDDVIFAGSPRRPTRDIAEVTLVLDNADRTAPSHHGGADLSNADALEVTRQISRGVGSDYRVNGRLVRARDVQLLFADAATGSRSPSMVRQGQVAELIAAKPTDRRNILEEAAGISGLRARKHEAALKLNAAEANLSRAEDVSAEVDRQMDTLRRQARQATRYTALSAEIRTLEATLHHLRWVDARAAARDAEAALVAAREAVTEAAAAQSRAAINHAVAQNALPTLRQTEAEAGASRQTAAVALEALDARERDIADRIAALAVQSAALEKDLDRQDSAIADAAAAEARLAREQAELDGANAGKDGRIATLVRAAADAHAAAEHAERDATVATEHAATAAASRAALDAACAKAAADEARAAGEVGRLKAALGAAQGSEAVRRRDAAAVVLDEAAEAEDAALRNETAAQEREQDAATREAAAAEALAAAEASVSLLKAELAAAESEFLRVNALIAERETEVRTLARLGLELAWGENPVIEACTVAPGYEAAFAAALGDDLLAPLGTTAPTRWDEAAAGGAATPSFSDPALPAGVEPLARHVTVPAVLRRRLAQVGLVADGNAPVQPLLAPGQRLVSREGAQWRWDGFVRDAGAPSAAAERLAQKNRATALAREIDALAPDRAAAEAEVAGARSGLTEARRTEDAAREALVAARTAQGTERRSLSTARGALAAARKTTGDARQRFAAAGALARDTEVFATRTAAALDAALAAAAAAGRAREAAAAARDGASTGASEVQERDRARTTALDARRRAASAADAAEAERRAVNGRARRLERLGPELADWRIRLAGTEAHRAELAARLAAASEARAALADAPSETILERRRLTDALADITERQAAANSARVAGDAAERTADVAARAALETLASARENAGRTDERRGAARTRLAEVEAALEAALDVHPAAAGGLAGLDPSAPLPDRAGLESRGERAKAERERLGGVNLAAADELAAIEARRGVMLAERDDLVAGIEALRQGIARLDRDARGRLIASFDRVNGEFGRLFALLFGGGEARLVLTEAADPLEAGLDIVARPPGKTAQGLSLLSGGEQTLTATALIFAVFLCNPSPICVLDEIDAPLDDANVERFCNLLAEMTRATETRFLVITHNPITMARMDRLYGVTMVEKGVSQLVSVTLGTADELRATG